MRRQKAQKNINYRPKRKYAKKGPTTKDLATRVKKLEHSDELKYIDYTNGTVPLTPGGIFYNYNQMAQGDNFNERVGEEITAKYLNMKVRIRHFANASADVVRCILFWDKQNNGLGPVSLASTSIGEGLLDDTTITQTTLSPHNYRTSERYTVLYDKLHIMNADSTGVNLTKIFKIKKNLGGAKVKYSSSGATFAALPSRCLWFLVLGNDFDATTAVQSTARLWYTDS